MFKRLLLIGALCISLVGLSGTQATAYPPRPGDVSWCPWCPGSEAAYFTTSFVGIANTDVVPTDVYIKWIIEDGEVFSTNPAGEDGGIGIPFLQFEFPLEGFLSTGEDTPMNGRGRWDGTFPFLYADIIAWLILNEVLDPLPNPQWSYHLIIRQALIRVTANTNVSDELCEESIPGDFPQYPDYPNDPEEQCTEPLPLDDGPPDQTFEEVVHGIYRCYAPVDGDDPVFDASDECDELFLWKYKNRSQLCEYEDPDGLDQPCDYEFPASPYLDWWDRLPSP